MTFYTNPEELTCTWLSTSSPEGLECIACSSGSVASFTEFWIRSSICLLSGSVVSLNLTENGYNHRIHQICQARRRTLLPKADSMHQSTAFPTPRLQLSTQADLLPFFTCGYTGCLTLLSKLSPMQNGYKMYIHQAPTAGGYLPCQRCPSSPSSQSVQRQLCSNFRPNPSQGQCSEHSSICYCSC